jgi:hypothetical protein
MASIFSLPQCVGYVALAFGVVQFLQKDDKRFKIISIFQCIAYASHFILLGNYPAACGNSISIIRNLLSLKTRSVYVALFLCALSIFLGVLTVKSPAGLLPICASLVAIVAMFRLDGVPLRLAFLTCTGMWLANNIICHSIGGVILETIIAATNTFTMVRMTADARAAAAA